MGDEEVRAKFGVHSSSLPDLFGLVGDAADNIPGLKQTRRVVDNGRAHRNNRVYTSFVVY